MSPETTRSRMQQWGAALLLLIFISFNSTQLFAGGGGTRVDCEKDEKHSEFGKYCGYSDGDYKGYKYKTAYLTMRDSVKIAIDIFLPKKMKKGEQVPTIIYQTRYIRSLRAKWPFNWLKNPVLAVIPEDEIKYFTSHGYACIIVDVRGSGASTGTRTMEFSPEEVKDGAEVVDWIIEQPWSDKKVATTGVSYFGTTAELLLVNKHPNVVACVPRSNIFDLYNHMMFPGGVRQGPFVDIWGFTTLNLDQNNLDVFGKQAKRLIKGASPVHSDKGKKIYKQAIEDHKGNFDVYSGIQLIDYRDEINPGLDRTSNDYSIHSNLDAIEASGTPIFRIGGWYDGALKKSVVEGYLNTDNTVKCMIGPWDHGPGNNASPFSGHNEVKFDVLGEILRFLDYHVKGVENGVTNDDEFYYFTVGEEQWKSANSWPPPGVVNTPYYFSGDNTITANQKQVDEGQLNYTIDYTCHTGISSRWNSQTGLYKNGPTNYNNWEQQSDKLWSFSTEPLKENMEITGSPVANLIMSADATDATVFVYIEDVSPEGEVILITEGMFRAIHRKISNSGDYVYTGPFHTFNEADAAPIVPGELFELNFDLLPISYQVKQGHTIRFSIAGTDCKHFDLVDDAPSKFTMDISEDNLPNIILPVMKGGKL